MKLENREINDRQDKKQTKDTLKEEQIKYIYKFGNDIYESIVWSYIDYEKKQLSELLENDSKNISYKEEKEKLFSNWQLLHCDFSYSIDDFLNDLEPVIISSNVNKILNIGDFHFFVRFNIEVWILR